MVLITPTALLFAAIASVSALSPPLPGVEGFKGSVNNLLPNSTAPTSGNVTHGLLQPSGKYIIQFHTTGISKRDADPHSAFHKRALESGLSYTTRQTYNNEGTFVGVSLELEEGSIHDLRNLENVANVWPVKRFGRPTAVLRNFPAQMESESRRRESSDDANVTFSIPRITGDIKPNNPHTMAGVDKAHAAGYYGEGVKIAVIDTGVDYLHPALGGCFGEGCKISFGYDFVGDNYPDETVESPTPLTQCILGGHGTHVMGKTLQFSL